MANSPRIIYTITDEAPALATVSSCPSSPRRRGRRGCGDRDISLAARILCKFPDMSDDQRVADDLAELGAMCLTPEANIIKLPNIGARCRNESRDRRVAKPRLQPADHPDHPATDEERDFKRVTTR